MGIENSRTNGRTPFENAMSKTELFGEGAVVQRRAVEAPRAKIGNASF